MSYYVNRFKLHAKVFFISLASAVFIPFIIMLGIISWRHGTWVTNTLRTGSFLWLWYLLFRMFQRSFSWTALDTIFAVAICGTCFVMSYAETIDWHRRAPYHNKKFVKNAGRHVVAPAEK